jgi:lipopolysaccharide/colanic/teichoic acid biosynthesis glycosyltransferase
MIFEKIVALVLIFFLLPLLVLLAILVRINMGSPILFKQNRAGMNGVPFTILKFRTMMNIENIEDGFRLTKLGKLLRSTSLDELPELFNVLKGDMSFVGPRPLLVEYLPRYSEFQSQRHNVRPGITGWAQINGRNSISWEDRFKMDIWYVENHSFYLDIKILCKTFFRVFNREGINPEGYTTMPFFIGNKNEDVDGKL